MVVDVSEFRVWCEELLTKIKDAKLIYSMMFVVGVEILNSQKRFNNVRAFDRMFQVIVPK